jgi:hypothetical protein
MIKSFLILLASVVVAIASPAPVVNVNGGGGSSLINATNAAIGAVNLGLTAAVTNFGVLSANTVYLSASTGSTNGVVGNPNKPFSIAQLAINACPAYGTVYFVDGNFDEGVLVTNNQSWYMNANTSLAAVSVASTAPVFNIYGSGNLGTDPLNYLYCVFTNNYSSLTIQCANFGILPNSCGLLLSSTNVSTTVNVQASGLFSVPQIGYLDNNLSTFTTTSKTNVIEFNPFCSGYNGGFTNYASNKSYIFGGDVSEFTFIPSVTYNPGTNVSVYVKSKQVLAALSSSTRFGTFFLLTNACRLTFDGCDISAYNNYGGALLGWRSILATNNVFFINCRINIGTNMCANTGSSSVGQINIHKINCVDIAPFSQVNTGTLFATNPVDNTLIDPAWTNSAIRY